MRLQLIAKSISVSLLGLSVAQTAWGQQAPQSPGPTAPTVAAPNGEAGLGEFVVTGTKVEHITKLAVLPSMSPDFEDVIVRSVVRRDLELSAMFELIQESKAPPGGYQIDDPVDVDAWKKLGAEVIVKLAARKMPSTKPGENRVEVIALAFLPEHGSDPVYERRFQTVSEEIRMTSHRVTDALLGAITGRPGGFSSRFAFSMNWGKTRRLVLMDADGEGLGAVTPQEFTAIAPAWGPDGMVFYSESRDYSPYRLMTFTGTGSQRLENPFTTSIYASAISPDKKTIAVAVAENAESHIYVGQLGQSDWKLVSTTQIATSPAFSPSGKLAWIGGGAKQGSQRVYVDGKPVSPDGYTAAAPTFCDTEDGVRLVYGVAVGNDKQDLVMSDEHGRGLSRLTQGQGSNYSPACSPDGRLLAFFSTRKGSSGLQMMSLKRFTTLRVNGQLGDSLDWGRRPPSASLIEVKPAPKKPAVTPATPSPEPATPTVAVPAQPTAIPAPAK